jgi:hypothetical protein
MITQELLKSRLHYNEETGIFTHITGKRNGRTIGENRTKDWYIGTKIDRRYYLLHRLAWLYVYGVWPKSQIDHLDRDKGNNRISNLRLATTSENQQNVGIKSTNKSGRLGVYWAKHVGKWHAQIKLHGKRHHLGYFDDIDTAYAAYLKARAELFPFHPIP